jgi:hypothetical protein
MILQPRIEFAPAALRSAAAVPCALDRHFGPFEALEPLHGWLGTDWFTCRGCRAVVTRANAAPLAAA